VYVGILVACMYVRVVACACCGGLSGVGVSACICACVVYYECVECDLYVVVVAAVVVYW
jgi:hypothetical protein